MLKLMSIFFLILTSLLKSIANDRIKNKKFTNWICCDLIILDNGLKLIGSSVLDPNANNFVDKFQKNSSSNLDILNLILAKHPCCLLHLLKIQEFKNKRQLKSLLQMKMFFYLILMSF